MEQGNVDTNPAARQASAPVDTRLKDSPLYGVRGFLLFFMLPMMLFGVAYLFNYGFLLSDGLKKIFSGTPDGWRVLGVGTAMYLPLLIVIVITLKNLFRGEIVFRKWYVLYAVLTILNGLLLAFESKQNIAGYLIYPAFVVIGCIYLFRSDRVRVTCGLEPLREHANIGRRQAYPKLNLPIRDPREKAYSTAEPVPSAQEAEAAEPPADAGTPE